MFGNFMGGRLTYWAAYVDYRSGATPRHCLYFIMLCPDISPGQGSLKSVKIDLYLSVLRLLFSGPISRRYWAKILANMFYRPFYFQTKKYIQYLFKPGGLLVHLASFTTWIFPTLMVAWIVLLLHFARNDAAVWWDARQRCFHAARRLSKGAQS